MENPTRQEITYLSRELLHPSETNPRKLFSQAALEELGRSIGMHGVIQPLIVRESVHWTDVMRGEKHYEIVAGERRFRSGSAVGLMEFPTIVRVLADWEVVELQLIENLQREDVSAYEEAEGYASLLELTDEAGVKLYTVERIADKIGKTPEYVGQRLKVRQAPQSLLAALADGRVSIRVCEIVGRIPHREDREKCAAEVLKPKRSDNPMTAKETAAHVAENYMNSLGRTVFDKKDAELVKSAGPCGTCPHRSGEDPDLDGLLATGLKGEGRGKKAGLAANMCLNPNCFRAKTEAHYKQLEKAGEVEVIPTKEAAKLFPYGDYLTYNSAYKLASEKPGHDDVGHYDGKKVKSWGAYAAALGVKVSVAKSPRTGSLIEVVDRSAVKTAEQLQAKKEGRPSVFAKQRSTENTAARKNDADRQKRDKEILNDSIRRALDGISGAMMGNLTTDPLLIALASVVDHEGIDILMRWMNLKAQSKPGNPVMRQDKVDAIIAEASDASRYDLEGVMILMVVATLVRTMNWYGLNDTRFTKLAALLGVDLKECQDQAKAAVKAAWAEKAKKTAQSTKGKAPKGEKASTVKRDADRVAEHFAKKGGVITRVSMQRAMDWSEERTIAVYDELVSRGVIAAQSASRQSGSVEPPAEVNESDAVGGEPNANGVFEHPESIVLSKLKGYVAIAKLALYQGMYYVGRDFSGPGFGSGDMPCIKDEGYSTRPEAIHAVAEAAHTFFARENSDEKPIPKEFFKNLEAAKSATLLIPAEIPEDVMTVVVECLQRSGTVKVGWQEICDILGAGLDADARERGLKVFDAMMDLGLIVKGVFNTSGVDAVFPQKDADKVDVKSANVPGSGKSKLAAAAEKKGGKVTLHKFPKKKPAADPSPRWKEGSVEDVEEREKLLSKLAKKQKTWGPETIFDLDWVKAWVPGVKEDRLAQILLDEAVFRGILKADQVNVGETPKS